MAKSTKKKPAKKKPTFTHYLTVCSDCKIKLIVHPENAEDCYLCHSKNITKSIWG